MDWTPAQRSAIEADNPDLLVSAAAGSGKTAVLVERVLRLLRQGADIRRMLIVTFTRAAAAEMRERIDAALEREPDSRHLYLQRQRLGRADISTLHHFCQTVIARHFELLGIDPHVRVGNELQTERLKLQAVEEVLEAVCSEPDEDQALLLDCYTPDEVAAMAEKLRVFILSLADPWEWAETKLLPYEGALEDHPAFSILCDECERRLEQASQMLDGCEALLQDPAVPQRFEKTLAADRELLADYMDAAKKRRLRAGKIKYAVIARAGKNEQDDPDGKQRYTDQRDRFKKTMNEAVAILPDDDAPALLRDNQARRIANGLYTVTRRIDERFCELKRRADIVDYSDLEHLCAQLLSDSAIRDETAGRYDHIFVDEYQDISEIQERIIKSVHRRNSLFLVGDVKQSIYRFRQAEPTLFMRHYREASAEPDAPDRKIMLQQNFRSSRNILAVVNHIFSQIMHEDTLEIEYDDEAALKPGPAAKDGDAAELHLLTSVDADTGDENKLTKGTGWEALMVARRIKELVRPDSETLSGRPGYRYRDIVILLRSASGRGAIYAETLRRENIPVYSDVDSRYYDRREIQDIMNLLRVIDNPYQDMPMLAVMRLPCFHFSPEELASIRLKDLSPDKYLYQIVYSLAETGTALGERVKAMLDRIDQWRFLLAGMPLDVYVRMLIDETGIYAAAAAPDDGDERQANLRLLCEKAGEAENLYDFLYRTTLRGSADDTRTAKTLSDAEDVVRIMTIHKSKGLEFPVVIVGDLAREFHLTEAKPQTDPRLGIGLLSMDPEKRVAWHTLTQRAITVLSEQKQKAEEARILYVALTRAKEKLILYGSPGQLRTALEKSNAPQTASSALRAGCMLDWILMSLDMSAPDRAWDITGENGARFRVFIDPIEELVQAEEEKRLRVPQPETGPVSQALTRMIEWQAPERKPLKQSVSALTHIIREPSEEETPPEKRNVPRETLEDRPRFLQEKKATGAERGTVLHKVLGLIPYSLFREENPDTFRAMRQYLDGMVARGLLTQAERTLVAPQDVLRFFDSSAGRRALQSQTVRREWSFNLKAPDGSLVQGVLDLCFLEDGAWVLLDYKTNRVEKADDLLPVYAEQLRWYARALRELTGTPVREALLYSVPLGETAQVTLEPAVQPQS